MAFLFKQTTVFDGPRHGWTEALYFERPSGDVQSAIDFLSDYKNKRRPLLGKQCFLSGQRTLLVRDDTGAKVTRQGLVNDFGTTLPGTQAQDAEDTGTSLLVVWSDAQSRLKKTMFLGGAWASIFPFANSYVPAGGWQGFFNAWRDYCITKHLGWMHRTVQRTATITNYVTDAATGIVTYTLRTGASIIADLTPRRTVNVEFFNRRSPLDGVQVVVPISEVAPVAPATDWTTTVKTAQPRPAAAFATPGQMTLFGSTFVDVGAAGGAQQTGSINPVRPTGRKRGRPLFVSPGRQANRVRF